MNPMYGTSVYCGIGIELAQIKEHLEMAASLGINTVFTSLQLPEADKATVLRDFYKMSEIAHSLGMKVEADVATRTAVQFGIDLHDLSAIKEMGVDFARLDGGYTMEQTVEATHNDLGMQIVLNAGAVTRKRLEQYESLGINKEQAHFCHNFYPMRYTGLQPERAREINALIHEYGYRVTGFIPSHDHKRIGVSLGLPTVERHRIMDTFTAIEECKILGFDDIFFGDDLASEKELRMLVERDPAVITLRMIPEVEGEAMDWLLGRELRQFQKDLPEIIRTKSLSSDNNSDSSFHGDCEEGIVEERRRGDVSMCKAALLRYAGEVQIARMDLPADPDIGRLGRIVDEDLPLLETFRNMAHFRLIRAEEK